MTDGALALLNLLRDHDEPVTKQEAADLDDGPSVAYSTIARYVSDLTDAGALEEVGGSPIVINRPAVRATVRAIGDRYRLARQQFNVSPRSSDNRLS